jgi:hypothetical protein
MGASSLDIPATIVACAGVLGPVGAGIGWIWRKVERRFRDIEQKLEACQSQHQKAHSAAEKLWTCVEIMVLELESHGAPSPALAIVRRILRDLYPITPVPHDMAETVEEVV